MSLRTRPGALALAIVLLLAAPAWSAEQPIACSVDELDGADARMWVSGVWRPLAAGADVPRDAIVVTGAETRAKIGCTDGLMLTVGVATEINLETLAGQRTGRVAQLVRGILGVISPRRLREEFIIRTPVATADLGGSDALVEFAPDKGAAVFVREGRPATVEHGGGSVELKPGEGVTIHPSGAAEPVKTWGPARIKAATDALGFDWRQG